MRKTATLLVALGAVLTTAIAANPVSASIAQPTVVSEYPATYTPNVQADAVVSHPSVYALEESGSTIFAGGTFHTVGIASVGNQTPTQTYIRSNIIAFDANTGEISSSFVPDFDGPVWTIKASGTWLYVGGGFTTVNGVARRGLAKIDAISGALDTSFQSPVTNGSVTQLWLVNGRLIAGGSFPKKLAALDPVSGQDTGYIALSIAGTTASNAGSIDVYRFAVDPAGTRLMAIGNFLTVNGLSRPRAFMLDLDVAAGTLDPWNYSPLGRFCRASFYPDYLRDVDFSPDGSYFVIGASGGSWISDSDMGYTICDAAARFETNNASPERPTWINYTGGDTIHSVAATGAAVYVQGHFRWLDNPSGRNFAGPGAVVRQAIAALDPSTGEVLPWNPTKSRNQGGKDFLVTPTGLWVGSDGKFFHGKYHWGIAFCPLPIM